MPRNTPPSFEALCREHSERVYRFCYRLCGNPDDAEDLLQEVLMRAYRGLEGVWGRVRVGTTGVWNIKPTLWI